MSFDVVTLGETMLRFTPLGFERFEHARSVDIHIGGSESNTAVGLARLGMRVAWVSRLTANPLGRMIAQSIRAQGVDVSQVVWTAEDRIGTYYLERGQPPRESQVFYDRQNSAMSRMTPHDWPATLLEPGGTRVFHATGITLGISSSAADTIMHAATLAKAAGALISFDLNYRARLWSPEEAKHKCEALLHASDLIFLPERDAKAILQIDLPDPEQTLEELCLAYPMATIVLTMGAHGAAARDPRGQYWYQPAWSAVEVERLGGGDAFSAGFLAGYLETSSVAQALRWGAAAAALKYTTPGDLPLIDRAAMEILLDGKVQPGISR